MQSRDDKRTVGEQFNPWRQACGFYPPDVVAALPAMKVRGTGRKLTHGHKLLYTRLVRRWGQAGPCFPPQKWLATQLGVSIRTIKNWMEDLEAFPLIKRRRRGRGEGGVGLVNEVTFLWHPIFEVQKLAPKDRVLKCKNDGFEVQTTVVSKCRDEHFEVQTTVAPYKEETRPKTCPETYPSSSSTEQNGRFVDSVEASPATTATTSESVDSDPDQNRPAPWQWSDEEHEQAREAMRAHLGAPMLPDLDLTRDVLAHMQGLDDVRLWLLDLKARGVRPRSAPGWGLLRSDSQGWPSRRADVRRQVDERRVMEAEARATDEAANAAAARQSEAAFQRFEQERQEFIEAAMVRGWRLVQQNSSCQKCYGFGRRDIHTGELDLCDCEAGRQLKRDLALAQKGWKTVPLGASESPNREQVALPVVRRPRAGCTLPAASAQRVSL